MSLNHLLSQVSPNAWANPRINSLVCDGNININSPGSINVANPGGVLATKFFAADGSAAFPTFVFQGPGSTSGLYLMGDNKGVGVSNAGVDILHIDNPLTSLVPFVSPALTVGVLSYPSADNGVSYMKSNGAGVLSLVQPTYGTVGYFLAGITYNIASVTTLPTLVSGASNITSASNGISATSSGFNVTNTGKYLIEASISAVSSTALTFAIGIGVAGSNLSSVNFDPVSNSSITNLSVSEIRSITAGQSVGIYVYLVSGGPVSYTVTSWNLNIKNVD